MPEFSKNQAIITALRSAGYQHITLSVVPKRFLFDLGSCQSELEFSRTFLDDTSLDILQQLMQGKILSAINQYLGKRVYVNANGITVTPRFSRN